MIILFEPLRDLPITGWRCEQIQPHLSFFLRFQYSTLANTLARHWPKGERLIADALNTQPEKSGLSAIETFNVVMVDKESCGSVF
ncbi:helix-turn-helix domain-containing protein [Candidatus Symbiopectobacterium sp. NZEC151]|nr:helix-turn-helix domain-containing protein [Candidatus Symbiopectobacterium sp. NZEC151]